MSKIGDYNLKLQEQAEELGFSTTQDAIDAGYVEGYDLVNNKARLVKPLDFSKALEEQEKAREAWLEERKEVLGELISVYNDIDVPRDLKKYIKHAIEFVKKGEC